MSTFNLKSPFAIKNFEKIHIFREDCKIMIEDDSNTRVDRYLDVHAEYILEVHYSVDNLWKEIQYEVNFNRKGYVPGRIVKSISLPWCSITDCVFEALVTHICDDEWIRNTLECVDVTWNDIGHGSLPSIVKLLTQCPHFKYIYLGGSGLGDEQVVDIVSFLSKQPGFDSFKTAEFMKHIVFLRQSDLRKVLIKQEPYVGLQRQGLLSEDWFAQQVAGYKVATACREERLASATPYFNPEDMIRALKLSQNEQLGRKVQVEK